MILTKIPGDRTWAPWVNEGTDIFVLESNYYERHIPKNAKFRWHGLRYRKWWTDSIDIASNLSEYADETCKEELIYLKKKRDISVDLSRKSNIDIDFKKPEGLEYYPFQKVGIQYALTRNNTLFGDEMGLGKTVQAIGYINNKEDINKVLIVCPNSVKINWKRELEKWLVKYMVIEIASAKYFPDIDTVNIVIANYETVRKYCYQPSTREINESKKRDKENLDKMIYDSCAMKNIIENFDKTVHIGCNRKTITELIEKHNYICNKIEKIKLKIENDLYVNTNYRHDIASFKWDLLVVDECHFIKSSKAQQSKAVYKMNPRHKLFLTGTPIVNRPFEIFPFLKYLDSETWKDKEYFFMKRYCNGSWKGSSTSTLPELQNKLRETILIRRLKRDVLTELPAKIRQVIEIEAGELRQLLKEEKEIYEKGEEEREALQVKLELAKVKDNDEEYREAVKQLKDVLSVHFSELARIRKETAERKIPYIIDFLDNILGNDNKVVFFCHHHVIIDELMKKYRKIAVKIDGRISDIDKRQQAIDSFQNNTNIKLFVGSIQASGVGITLTASSHVVFGELDWVPGNMQQAEDRCHRIGQSESVLVQLLVLAESIDAKMAHTIIKKIEIIEKALDNECEDVEAGIIDDGEYVRSDKKQIERLAPFVSDYSKQYISEGLRILDSLCDGAKREDMSGFNRVDTRIGKFLSQVINLSNKQALLGMKLCYKYRRQLPSYINDIIYSEIERIKEANTI